MILKKQDTEKGMFVSFPSAMRETLAMKLSRQKNEQLILAVAQRRVKEAQETCAMWEQKAKNGMPVPKMYMNGFATHLAEKEQKYIESMVWALENGTEKQKDEARQALNKYAQEHAEEIKKEQENAGNSETFGQLSKREDGFLQTPIYADDSGMLSYVLPDGTKCTTDTKDIKQNNIQQVSNGLKLKEVLKMAMETDGSQKLPTKAMVLKGNTR